MIPWLYLAIFAAAGLVSAALLCLWLVRSLGQREPYASFVRLSIRSKIIFFRYLLQDNRVPIYLKLVPPVVAIYIISPIDLIPGIPLDDIALAFLALALIIRFIPRHVLQDLLERAAAAGSQAPSDSVSDNGRG